MSGLGFTRWGTLMTIALSVSFCTVDYASANVTASTSVQGNAGNITINSDSFSLQDGAQLVASTREQGNADTIKVNAADLFTISGIAILNDS
jgi:large exoprotein involved in heme utilization and adhesion